MHNHIGAVHVIAICNGLEAAMKSLAEATVPHKRWIPEDGTVAVDGVIRLRVTEKPAGV